MTDQAGPRRIQLSRKKGFRLPPGTVVVSRPTKWGNPFKVDAACSREEATKLHRSLLVDGRFRETASVSATDGALYAIGVRAEIQKLRGMNLACWCSLDGPCHADVLLELANEDPR